MLIRSILNKCTVGCLQCDIYQQCRFCDFNNFFAISNSTCVLKTLPNCVQMDINGICINCQGSSFYLDTITKNCVLLSTSDIILFCAIHSKPGLCVECQSNYYLQNNICRFVEKMISYCLIYNTKSSCSLCAPFYYSSSEGRNCLPVRQKPNCAVYSQYQCTMCSSGYILNNNMYFNQFDPLFYTSPSSYYGFLMNFVGFKPFLTQPNVCQPVAPPNCSSVNQQGICLSCQTGFYLANNKTCQIIQQTLPFCQRFLVPNYCMECIQGYNLVNAGFCKPVETVPNCNRYSQTSTSTNCTSCLSGMYPANGTFCQIRLNNITFCKIYDPFYDRCQTCETGFIQSFDGLFCLKTIINCTDYSTTKIMNSTNLTCINCVLKNILNSTQNACFEGNISNCSIYYPNTRLCKICDYGFYQKNFTCQKSRDISNCLNYSQNLSNVCEKCDNSTILTTIQTQCFPVIVIPNCILYTSPTMCSQCALGYYVLWYTVCEVIPPSLNCLNYTGQICLQCKTDYILISNGTCRLALDIYKVYCNVTNVTGQIASEVEDCSTCARYSYPVDYFEMYYCVEKFYIPQTISSKMDANCQNWRLNIITNVYECVQCFPGFFLASITSCTPACTALEMTTIYSYIVPQMPQTNLMKYNTILTVRTCGTTITNCLYASVQVPQSSQSTTYICTECAPNFVNMVLLNDPTIAMFPHTTSYIPAVRRNMVLPKVSCENPAGKTLLNIFSNSTQLTSNCEYYYDLPNWMPNTACLKCKWGFTGRVVDYIANCFEFNGNTCIECRAFNFPVNPLTCKGVYHIPKCKTYDTRKATTSCTVCDNAFWLKPFPMNTIADFCENSTHITGCDRYSQIVDACISCISTYYFINGLCYLLPLNCLTMELDGMFAKCNLCNNLVSYLNAINLCPFGTIINCSIYSANTNECLVCNNGYYLASSTSCLIHPSNPSCLTFSQTISGRCDVCNPNALMFSVVKTCKALTLVDNCLTFTTPALCSDCIAGYQLSSDMMSCLPTSTLLNCYKYSALDMNADGTITSDDWIVGNIFLYSCAKCQSGFSRFATSTAFNLASGQIGNIDVYSCVSYFNFINQNCIGNNNDGSVVFPRLRCSSGCSTNFLPIEWINLHMCIENTYLSSKNALVSNCLQYIWSTNAGNYVCHTCKDGFYLEVNSCVQACSNQFITFLWVVNFNFNPNPTHFAISFQNFCGNIVQTGIDANCKTVAPEFSLINARYSCLQCSITSVNLIAFSDSFSILSPFDFNSFTTTVDSRLTSPFYAYPSINQCFPYSVTVPSFGTVDATGLIPNCLYYADFSNGAGTNFGCVRCRFGYTGPIILDTNSNLGYIQSCSIDNTCNINTVYTGLQGNDQIALFYGSLHSLFSCHKCITSTPQKIPVAFVALSPTSFKVRNLLPYTIPNTSGVDLNTNSLGFEQNSVLCLDPTDSASFGMTTASIPTNCALLIVNVIGGFDASDPSGNDFTKMSALCVACKPGFYPTFSTSTGFSHVIISCTSIVNCPSNKGLWLNSCSTCNTFAVQENFNLIDFTVCTTNSISNCLIGTNTLCKACGNGYSLSEVNTCLVISAPYCLTNTVLRNDYYIFSGTGFGYTIEPTPIAFFLHNSFLGCTSCSLASGTSLVYVQPELDTSMQFQVCAGLTNYYTTGNPAFNVQNCANYGFSAIGAISCLTCSTNFVVTNINTCVSSTLFPNCALVNVFTNKCINCVSSNFDLLNGVCIGNSQSTLILNCVTYTATTATSSIATCEICANYFVPSVDQLTCVAFNQETFQNCLQVNIDRTACTKCIAFYVLVTINSGAYCYPVGQLTSGLLIDHDNNCLDLVANQEITQSFQFYKLTCNRCKNNYIPSTINIYDTYCYKFMLPSFETANCSSYYPIQPIMSNLQTICLACSPINLYYYNSTSKDCRNRTQVSNCVSYNPNANQCQTCPDGWGGSDSLSCYQYYIPKNHLPDNIGYIERCSSMSTCNATIYYGGLIPVLSMIFSCHFCNNPVFIPFAFISGRHPYVGFLGLKEYGLWSYSGMGNFAGNVNGTSLVCLNPRASSFYYNTAKFRFPSNCGLGFANVDSSFDSTMSIHSTNVDLRKIGVFCVACKPLFMPTYATSVGQSSVPLMISQCSSIPNCGSSMTFNTCDFCSNGYSLLYTAGIGISSTVCIYYPSNPSCLAAVSTNGPCQICKQGFMINRDGICEFLFAVDCSTAYAGLGSNTIEIQTYLAMQPFSGCNLCFGSFYSVYSLIHMTLCTYSPYIQAQIVASNNYVPYCSIYRNIITQNSLICMMCNPGFILTTTSRCTELTLLLANCFIALSTTQCSICSQGFANVDYICVPTVIQNCQTFYPFSTEMQKCLYCASTFYLSNNQCFAGTIANCSVYTGYDICSVCQQGYILLRLPNYTTQCFPIPVGLNCISVDESLFYVNQIRCTACSSNYVVYNLSSTDHYSHCYDFPKDPRCINFDIQELIVTSSFVCTNCVSSYFLSLNQNVCFFRFSSYSNCQIYDPFRDKCNLCNQGYYLSVDRTSCILFQAQAASCTKFDERGFCVRCSSFFYVLNNTCVLIEQEKIIPNCIFYDNNQNCYQCESGFLLIAGNCTKTIATNCLTYSDPNNCQSCSSGFGILTINGTSNCVFKNIQNCVQSTNFFPFFCQVCDLGYYPNNEGFCSIVSNPVLNCRYYLTDGICAMCFDNYILSNDTSKCVSFSLQTISNDPICQSMVYSEAGVCIICAPGYRFLNGDCIACFSGLAESCLICDLTDRNKCLMCNFGYYQTFAGECLQLVQNLTFLNSSNFKLAQSVQKQNGVFEKLTVIGFFWLILIVFWLE